MIITRKEAVGTTIAALAIAGLLAVLGICSGCANRGVKVVASSASATNLGDINWDEYKIPVFSIVSGPRTTVWVNKDYFALESVHAGGAVTNDTSALGIYSDKSARADFVDLVFRATTCHTNSPAAATKSVTVTE